MTIYQCSTCGKAHDSATDAACPQVFTFTMLTTVTARPWPDEVRARAIAAGYGDVLFGQCDVEGVRANGDSYCKAPHDEGPRRAYSRAHGTNCPEIWSILADVGVPTSSASCHWIGLDRDKMTPEQKAAVSGQRFWVYERWRDKHDRDCERLHNRYAECKCAKAGAGGEK